MVHKLFICHTLRHTNNINNLQHLGLGNINIDAFTLIMINERLFFIVLELHPGTVYMSVCLHLRLCIVHAGNTVDFQSLYLIIFSLFTVLLW